MDGGERPEPASDASGRPRRLHDALRAALWLAVVGGLGVVIWMVATRPRSGATVTRWLPVPRPLAAAVAQGYVGDRACRECHPGETAAHSRSGHSRTLRLAAEIPLAHWLDGKRVSDPENRAARWSYSLRGRQLMAERTEAGESMTYPLDYAFGSGHHAVTFVTITKPEPRHVEMLEHRLTYFANIEQLDVTPGQPLGVNPESTTPAGRYFADRAPVKCFGCHATVLSSRGQSVLDVASLMANVGCERCHGPAAEHVEQARRGGELPPLPQSPGTWTAAEQMKACGECHRHPSAVPPEQVRTDNGELARFQPVSLMMSACYAKSDGALSCVSCHDPHARPSTDRAAYESVCLGCHQAPERKLCPVSARSGCIGCHMPQRDAGQGVLFTDHWIRIPERKEAQPAQ